MTVDLTLDAGRVADYAQDVRACALGQAAASVVGDNIIGPGPRNAPARPRRTGGDAAGWRPPPTAPFDGLAVLEPARDYRNRHASILLALDATLAAFDDAAA